MLTNYIQAAMRKGHYEILPDGKATLAVLLTFRRFGQMQIRWKLVERNYEKS